MSEPTAPPSRTADGDAEGGAMEGVSFHRNESTVSPKPTIAVPGEGGVAKIIPFDALARCGEEVWIENAGQIYRLRRTRQGKLILTK